MALTQISRSLRFNSADSAYLNRTPASAGNRKTFTFSCWYKISQPIGGTGNRFFSARTDDNNRTNMGVDGNGYPLFINHISGTSSACTCNDIIRDVSAWYHFVFAIDTTQATDTNRVKIYKNGVLMTFSSATYPAQNADTQINNNIAHAVGRTELATPTGYCNGYMTEINFIDGQALTPSSFGFNSSDTGVWSPKQYTGPFGTNGFYVNFSDNSDTTSTTLGKDYSGNGNNWTPNNFSVTAGVGNDSLVDSPTAYGTDTGVGGSVRGNYCTWNPLMKASQVTLTNGNLDAAHGTFGTNTGVFGGIAVSSGKWYWEETITALSSGAPFIGIMKPEAITQTFTTLYANTTSGYAYRSTGDKRTNSSDSAYGASYTTNDVIGVALDMDAGTLVFYKNGVSQGTAFSSLSGTFVAADANGTSGGTYSSTINFGQRAFSYTAPSGFQALVTTNLPTPTIGATSTTQANDYFNPVLYSGNGTSQTIDTGLQPDFIWIKRRNGAAAHTLTDSVRGTSKQLFTNLTDAEQTDADSGVTAISSSSMTLGDNNLAVGSVNGSGSTYVAWNWKANGAGSSNTSGSITSTVSANTTSGFSIVTYTGNGSAGATVGHGLGVTPSMFIVKSRSLAESWPVYHISLGATKLVRLQATSAEETISTAWNDTAPTSTVFSLGSPSGFTNSSGATYVAYCFAPVAGYSAFGSYTGNGSTDGPFVYLGFRPAYVLVKLTSSSGQEWCIQDSSRLGYNPDNAALFADLSDAEYAANLRYVDFTSNGFKIRNSTGNQNASGGTYIYACFAESPFKYALAR
jgi:hypothetical protein